MAERRPAAADFSAAEMAELLGVYIDETAEQCEQLVAALLALEQQPDDAAQIAVAFRMVHSIKGSAAMLGFDRITAVAHHLESHFEKLRAGTFALDRETIQVALGCVDYFRDANVRLVAGEPLANGGELIDAVKALAAAAGGKARSEGGGERRVRVRLEAGLALPEVKLQLVLTRLARLGTAVRSLPTPDEVAADPRLRVVDVLIHTTADSAAIVVAADADGVESVELDPVAAPGTPAPGKAPGENLAEPRPEPRPERGPPPAEAEAAGAETAAPPTAVAETMRVGVDRLDVLLDLAGELVVTRARFAQLVSDLAPVFRTSGGPAADRHEGQRRYGELVESVDHLTRVVDSLQRGVLGTRMVPIGPLFGRFRRSVRDIAHTLGKDVSLELVGEQTELDKRMIDELGDPLVHLIRNAIDHGIEPMAVRAAKGKPATATLRLEASHRGNEVVIAIGDDGGGIDVARVRERAVDRGLVAAERAVALSPREVFDFIWQPGFSTAREVSAISGRGVGMDIVRTKIASLNGSVDVDSTPGVGTTFTLRLPLTLAISRCMLFRFGGTAFAIPVEHLLEIVTVPEAAVLAIAGRRVCDIRGEFLPLVEMRDVFSWPGGPPAAGPSVDEPGAAALVIRAAGRTAVIGVPTLLGTRDLVIKPLDDNFHRIRGLGGASVLGDGEVCLLIDAAAMIDMALRPRSTEHAS